MLRNAQATPAHVTKLPVRVDRALEVREATLKGGGIPSRKVESLQPGFVAERERR